MFLPTSIIPSFGGILLLSTDKNFAHSVTIHGQKSKQGRKKKHPYVVLSKRKECLIAQYLYYRPIIFNMQDCKFRIFLRANLKNHLRIAS